MGRRGRRKPIGALTNIVREPGAWSVIVMRKGHRFSDYFGDAVWGGREPARLAAQRFRDELLLRIGPDTRVRRQIPRGSRNATGEVGVSFEPYVVDGRVYHRYIAYWQDPEEGQQRRRFLVERYGKEQARALARDARESGLALSHARQLALQRDGATRRLEAAAPMPRQVRNPLSRKGISMARRRPRRVK